MLAGTIFTMDLPSVKNVGVELPKNLREPFGIMVLRHELISQYIAYAEPLARPAPTTSQMSNRSRPAG
jgi:hypothetical protein